MKRLLALPTVLLPASPEKKPNIVIIFIHDMGCGAIYAGKGPFKGSITQLKVTTL